MGKQSQTYIFNGILALGKDEDYSSALYLVDPTAFIEKGRFIGMDCKPLAYKVDGLPGIHRNQITVSYHITDAKVSEDELNSLVAHEACGEVDVEYYHRYSELTGYLWTEENFNVGGHDMIRELSSYLGKWCWLKIVVH